MLGGKTQIVNQDWQITVRAHYAAGWSNWTVPIMVSGL
jgi:hypothetical protein